MSVSYSTTLRNARLSAVATALANGSAELRTGDRPAAGAQASATGSVLATFTFDGTPFAAPSNGAIALADTPLETTATGTGTAGYLRLRDASSNGVADLRIGHEITMPSASVTTGEPVRITAGSLSEPIGTEDD